jgi:MprA protease rhombosortase-interaction domain-containing protein
VLAGALIWLDRLAAQLTPEVVQQLAAAGFDDVVSMSLTVWDELLQSCGNPDVSPWSAVALLLPGLLNLARRVALLPADTSAPAGLDSCDQGRACEQLAYVMQIYGRVLAYAWTQWPGVDPRAAQHGTALTSPGQTARRLWSAEQIAALWSAEQIAALQSCQVRVLTGAMSSLPAPVLSGTIIRNASLVVTALHEATHAVHHTDADNEAGASLVCQLVLPSMF